LTALLDVAPEFRLDPSEARIVLDEVCSATSSWREVAERTGLQEEIDIVAPAFEHAEAEEARAFIK
jgi:hypothetical protein